MELTAQRAIRILEPEPNSSHLILCMESRSKWFNRIWTGMEGQLELFMSVISASIRKSSKTDSPGYIKGIVICLTAHNGANWNNRREPVKSDYGAIPTPYHLGNSGEARRLHNRQPLMINLMSLVIMGM
jgi:hypothetical protein